MVATSAEAGASPHELVQSPRRVLALTGPWALIAAMGTCLGIAVVHTWGQANAQLAPEGWSRAVASAEYIDPTRLGPLRLDAYTWTLDAYRAVSTTLPVQRLELDIELPVGGELTINLDERAGIHLTAGQLPKPKPALARCEGELPRLAAGPVTVVVVREKFGFTTHIGEAALSCPARIETGPTRLTPGLRRVALRGLTVNGETQPQPLDVGRALGGGVLGAVLALLFSLAEWRLAFAPNPAGAAKIGLSLLPMTTALLLANRDLSALREILRAPKLEVEALAVVSGVLFTLAAKVLLYAPRVLTSTVPLYLPTAVVTVLAAGLVTTWGAKPHPEFGVLLLGVPLLAGGLAGRLDRGRGYAGAAFMASIGLFAGAGLTTGAGLAASGGRFYLSLAAAALALLLWFHFKRTQVRFYNLGSSVLLALALVYVELGTRFTELGSYWVVDTRGRGAGSITTLVEQFEAMEAGSSSQYPTSGFPVQTGPKMERTRIACLGASSTGGAYQHADLSIFYPARLDQLLSDGVEVVNQGAGAWTSFQVRQFSSLYLNKLDADIVTVYLGVNEATASPMTYVELHERWRSGTLDAPPSRLTKLRLFNGLRFMLRGLQGETLDAVVPPAHFKNNLTTIVDQARARGAKVLLMSEALRPDPQILNRYWAVLRDLANRHQNDGAVNDVAFLDTAASFELMEGPYFEDSNHLSAEGHALLAGMIHAELLRLGWLSPTLD